jgi:hypothetical protein
MNDLHARRPMINLQGVLAGVHGLESVGSRGIAKDYRELGQLMMYDALLLNANGEPVIGVASIHGYNAAAKKRIAALAGRQLPFVTATLNPHRLERLVVALDELNPVMAGELFLMLPNRLMA